MVFGLVAAIGVALGAVILWALSQKKLSASDQLAQEAAAQSEAKIQSLTSDVTAAQSEASAAIEKLAEQKSEKHRLSSDLQTARAELTQAEADLEHVTGKVASLESELELATVERDKLAHRLAKDKEVLSRAQEQIAIDSLSGVSPIRSSTLWDLELTRSLRTWRNSVATNPEADGSPFDDAESPVRSAVEVEADALREDVGAAVRVDWRVDNIEDPARCHLVLRLAQEMMASAAREPQPTVLVVEGDDELSLRIEPDSEAGDSVIALSPPKINSDLIDISSEHGLIVTLKAANPAQDPDSTETAAEVALSDS